MSDKRGRDPERAAEGRERRAGGAHALPTSPPAMRVAKVGAAVVILALIGVLLVFGDSLLGGGGGHADGDADDPPTREPGISEADQEQLRPAVTGAAATVLETWARPGVGYDGWWKRLRPLLTPGAQQAYAFTDTRQLPDLDGLEPTDATVHGLGRQATVFFDTDAGRYGVDLSRKNGEWLANRVIFPDGESMFG